jgi:hypothetical protein
VFALAMTFVILTVLKLFSVRWVSAEDEVSLDLPTARRALLERRVVLARAGPHPGTAASWARQAGRSQLPELRRVRRGAPGGPSAPDGEAAARPAPEGLAQGRSPTQACARCAA